MKMGTTAGFFPAENENRENDRENTPTVFVPIPARFPLFSPFPVFSEKIVYGRIKR